MSMDTPGAHTPEDRTTQPMTQLDAAITALAGELAEQALTGLREQPLDARRDPDEDAPEWVEVYYGLVDEAVAELDPGDYLDVAAALVREVLQDEADAEEVSVADVDPADVDPSHWNDVAAHVEERMRDDAEEVAAHRQADPAHLGVADEDSVELASTWRPDGNRGYDRGVRLTVYRHAPTGRYWAREESQWQGARGLVVYAVSAERVAEQVCDLPDVTLDAVRDARADDPALDVAITRLTRSARPFPPGLDPTLDPRRGDLEVLDQTWSHHSMSRFVSGECTTHYRTPDGVVFAHYETRWQGQRDSVWHVTGAAEATADATLEVSR